MSTPKRPAPKVRTMLAVGWKRVRRYSGLTLTLFGVQLALSALAGFAATRILAGHFATRPLFDRAVEGDVVAFFESLRDAPGAFTSVMWLMVAALLSYVVWSWFASAGVLQVFLTRPHGRGNVAETFGRGGARHLFRFARLFALCVPLYFIIFVAASLGLSSLGDVAIDQQTLGALLSAAAPRLLPALVLWFAVSTVVDYARVDLVRHVETGSRSGAFRAFGRACKLVATRWQPLAHKLLFVIVFIGLSAAYLAIVGPRTLSGSGGALTLLCLRVFVSLARFAAGLITIGGQAELAELTVFPPKPREKRRKRRASKSPDESAAA